MTRSTKIKRSDQFIPESNKLQKKTTTIISKVRKSGKPGIFYFEKAFHFSPMEINRYIGSLEAILAALYRFLGTPACTPKVRVTVGHSQATKEIYSVVSKEIEGFKIIRILKETTMKKILNSKQRQFARLLISAYVLEEADLHTANWGINHQEDILKIDHDMSAYSIAAELTNSRYTNPRWCLNSPYTEDINQNFTYLKDYPNLVYTPKEYYAFISNRDILNLPYVTDAKPHNWPTQKNNFPFPSEFKEIKNDPEFKKWKFFYFAKALFLNRHVIETIANDHSRKCDEKEKNALITHLNKRIEKLKEVLLNLPEFRQFLATQMPGLKEEFKKEIRAYNAEFMDRKTRKPKRHRKHRIINLDEVDAFIIGLFNESKKKSGEDTYLNQKKILFSQAQERQTRETRARDRLRFYLKNRNTPLLVKGYLITRIENKEDEIKKINEEMVELKNAIKFSDKPELNPSQETILLKLVALDPPNSKPPNNRIIDVFKAFLFPALNSDKIETKLTETERKKETKTKKNINTIKSNAPMTLILLEQLIKHWSPAFHPSTGYFGAYESFDALYTDFVASEIQSRYFVKHLLKSFFGLGNLFAWQHWLSFPIPENHPILSQKESDPAPTHKQLSKEKFEQKYLGSCSCTEILIKTPFLSFILILNLLKVILAPLSNLIKLFFVILPSFLIEITKSKLRHLDVYQNPISSLFAYLLLYPAYLMFNLIYTLLLPLATPEYAIATAWRYGKQLGGTPCALIGSGIVIALVAVSAFFVPKVLISLFSQLTHTATLIKLTQVVGRLSFKNFNFLKHLTALTHNIFSACISIQLTLFSLYRMGMTLFERFSVRPLCCFPKNKLALSATDSTLGSTPQSYHSHSSHPSIATSVTPVTAVTPPPTVDDPIHSARTIGSIDDSVGSTSTVASIDDPVGSTTTVASPITKGTLFTESYQKDNSLPYLTHNPNNQNALPPST